MAQDSARTRTVTWEDPLPAFRKAGERSGLEHMRAYIRGEFPAPPIARTLGFELVEVDEGKAVFVCTPAEYHYNPIGSVHGGLAATLLDSAMGCAVHTVMPQGVAYTTIELHVNYLRPLTSSTGPVRCEGRVIHAGRRLATAEGYLTDADGKLYAHGSTTCMVFEAPKP